MRTEPTIQASMAQLQHQRQNIDRSLGEVVIIATHKDVANVDIVAKDEGRGESYSLGRYLQQKPSEDSWSRSVAR